MSENQKVRKVCRKPTSNSSNSNSSFPGNERNNNCGNNDSGKDSGKADKDKVKESSLYDVLGVSKDATPAEIKAQFLKLSLVYHPDKETGDAVKFKSIMLAYKVLSSKKKRTTYDESLSNTWDELKEVQRDVGYHVTTEHTKIGKDGVTREVDIDSFNQAFMSKRNDEDASLISQMLKDGTDLGTSNPMFGKIDAISVEDTASLLAKRMQQRNLDEDLIPGSDSITFDNLRDNWDSNLFNQIFNSLKAKKQELADYEERNDDEFLTSADPILGNQGNHQSQGSSSGLWNSSSSTMFGKQNSGTNSNMGGLGSLGGLRRQDQSDDHLLGTLDLQGLLVKAQQERATNYDVTYTRDTRECAEDLQVDEYERRMREIRQDRDRLFNLDSNDFIVRKSMIAEALGDPTLFDDSIMTIDPVGNRRRRIADSVNTEDNDDEESQE